MLAVCTKQMSDFSSMFKISVPRLITVGFLFPSFLSSLGAQALLIDGGTASDGASLYKDFEVEIPVSANPLSVASVSADFNATDGNEGLSSEEIRTRFIEWGDSGKKAAYIFLVDVSDVEDTSELRTGTKTVEVGIFKSDKEVEVQEQHIVPVDRDDIVREYARMLSGAVRTYKDPEFALYTYSDSLDRDVKLGQSPIDFNDVARGLLSPNTESNSEKAVLYQAIYESLQDLADHSADRKALIVMGSGRTDDEAAFDERKVVDLAVASGISIYSLGGSSGEQNRVFLNFLKNLSGGTNGLYQEVSSDGVQNMDSDFIQTIFDNIENGGELRVTLPAKLQGRGDIEIELTLSDESVVQVSRPIELVEATDFASAVNYSVLLDEQNEASQTSELESKNLSTFPVRIDPDSRTYVLDLSFNRAVDLVDVSLDESSNVDFKYTPFESSRADSAYVYLLDTSDTADEEDKGLHLAVFKSVLLRLIEQSNEKQLAGVGTLGDSLNMLLALDKYNKSELTNKVLSMEEGSSSYGVSSNFYDGAYHAIDQLAEADNETRKILVVFSTGRTEVGSGKYSIQALSDYAKEAGVIVRIVGLNVKNPDALLKFEPFSANGTFDAVTFEEDENVALLPSSFFENFYGIFENGGQIEFNLPPSKRMTEQVNMVLTFSDDVSFEFSYLVDLGETTQIQSSDNSDDVDSLEDGSEKSFPLIVILVGAAVVCSVIIVVVIIARRKTRNVEVTDRLVVTSNDEVSDLPPPPDLSGFDGGSIFGWIEMVDSTGRKHPINLPAFRIGRNESNDLVFQNDSVSGFHAEIVASRDGSISISDLDSSNKVYVNGLKVDVATLKDGDLVDLGEVKFRFISK